MLLDCNNRILMLRYATVHGYANLKKRRPISSRGGAVNAERALTASCGRMNFGPPQNSNPSSGEHKIG